MHWKWQLREHPKQDDVWVICARPTWWPFWIYQDVRRGYLRGVEHMACLMVNSQPPVDYASKCKRRRTDGPTPCLCCPGECVG